MDKVRAKFRCDSVLAYQLSKEAHLSAVYGKEGENADFTKYTPSGSVSILIENESKAADLFKPGKEYYLDFTESE